MCVSCVCVFVCVCVCVCVCEGELTNHDQVGGEGRGGAWRGEGRGGVGSVEARTHVCVRAERGEKEEGGEKGRGGGGGGELTLQWCVKKMMRPMLTTGVNSQKSTRY